MPDGFDRWQVWAIAAGGVVVYGAVRSGLVSAFGRFLARHRVTVTFFSIPPVAAAIEPATHVANAGSALIQAHRAAAEASRNLEAVIPILPNIATQHGIFEPDPDALVVGSRRVLMQHGIRGGIEILRPLIQQRESFFYLWDLWRSRFSSSGDAIASALDIYSIVASFRKQDFVLAAGIGILVIFVSEGAYRLCIAYADGGSGTGNGPPPSPPSAGAGGSSIVAR